MRSIATHRAPNADALASAWLAQRFLFSAEESQVIFVARSWTPTSRKQFDCVVDVGRAHEPERCLFDHKPPALSDRNASCATRLLWEFLVAKGLAVAHLKQLVLTVHEGDRVPPRLPSEALALSRSDGLHALVAANRRDRHGDEVIYKAARAWLDDYNGETTEACPQVLEGTAASVSAT